MAEPSESDDKLDVSGAVAVVVGICLIMLLLSATIWICAWIIHGIK
jgi:hypothetical protein